MISFKLLFGPGIRLMRQLRIATKMSVMGLFLLVPLMLLLASTWQGAQVERSFAADISDPKQTDQTQIVFTILWSADEPHLVGATAEVAPSQRPLVLGREGNLRWSRARPGREEPSLGPKSKGISREQLTILFTEDGRGALIESSGRRELLLNGKPVPSCPLVPGSILEVDGLLLVRCERRKLLDKVDVDPRHGFGEPDAYGMVGETPAAWELRSHIAFCSGFDHHVLVRGASGSGKELVSRAVHGMSRRSRGPFVSRSAATVPGSLIDAELFGNLANYPNPGMPARPGLVGEADGGTLFLDEVGELSTEMQARLLRVLDAGEYTRLGEAKPRRADLRLVAATNRPPTALKHDLSARLQLGIVVPGLDERRSDVPLLAAHLLRGIIRCQPRLEHLLDDEGHPKMTARLVRALVEHPYQTHTRELSSLLLRALQHSAGERLDLWPTYAEEVRAAAMCSPPQPAPIAARVSPESLTNDEILACLERNGGLQEPTARELGLKDRHALVRLMEERGMRPKRPRKKE